MAFYIAMLTDPVLAQVWCETEDDITLIWERVTGETVEFVQVKHEQFDRLWSVALICAGDAATNPPPPVPRATSLLERSLDHDRCRQPCSFRIVTSWPLHPDLRVLTLPLAHHQRRPGEADFETLVRDIVARAERDARFVSENGTDADFWVRNVVWDVRESLMAVENANLLALDAYAASLGSSLAYDQRAEVYTKLLLRAKNAAEAPYDPDPASKKLAGFHLLEYVRNEIRNAEHPSLSPDGAKLRGSLEAAGFSEETIEAAWDLRSRYRAGALNATYLDLEEREIVEGEVLARLNQLRSAWNAREFDDSPEQFHSRCLHALEDLCAQVPVAVTTATLQGVMYDITARGSHRFTRYSDGDLPAAGVAPDGRAA